jgi:hypothetical protein
VNNLYLAFATEIFLYVLPRNLCLSHKIGDVFQQAVAQQLIYMPQYQLFSEPEIVKTIKIGRLRWAGQVIRIMNDKLVKNISLLKPDGCRRVGRPKVR